MQRLHALQAEIRGEMQADAGRVNQPLIQRVESTPLDVIGAALALLL